MTSEPTDHRLKRLRMRSWRRGTREMDLILGPFADQGLALLSARELDFYEKLLQENDQDLYQWFSGQVSVPADYTALIELISVGMQRGLHK